MGKFQFKRFAVDDSGCGQKVCSDSVLMAVWFCEPYACARHVLDVGTGSGVLALLAAQICPGARVDSVDIDAGAAADAAANFTASPWPHRMRVYHSDIATAPIEPPYDLILCNPPYFSTGATSPDTARARARHQEGLTYSSVISLASGILSPDGHLGLVAPAELEADIIYSAEMARLKVCRLMRVKTSRHKAPTRLLVDITPQDCHPVIGTLCMRDADGTLSDPYREIVAPYYLKI